MKHTLTSLALTSLLTASLFSCKKDKDEKLSGTFYGSSKAIGGGTAKSFIKVDNQGQPVAIGFAISETAMDNLPAGDDELEYILDLPAKAVGKTPYKFMELDYNPHGHEPDGIYNVPHFDFHSYSITNDERMAITPGDPKLNIDPPAAYLPAGYIPGAPVPMMGKHWVDPESPEFHGQPFTTTFIYGSYNGKVTFMEPMITVAYLKSTEHQQAAIKQPQKFATASNYPTTYTINHNHAEKQYEITLEGFQAKTAD